MPASCSTITVTQDAEKPVEKPALAQAIVDISKAAEALASSGLNRGAIVLLVAHSASVPQGTVKAVLDSLESLTRDYTSTR